VLGAATAEATPAAAADTAAPVGLVATVAAGPAAAEAAVAGTAAMTGPTAVQAARIQGVTAAIAGEAAVTDPGRIVRVRAAGMVLTGDGPAVQAAVHRAVARGDTKAPPDVIAAVETSRGTGPADATSVAGTGDARARIRIAARTGAMTVILSAALEIPAADRRAGRRQGATAHDAIAGLATAATIPAMTVAARLAEVARAATANTAGVMTATATGRATARTATVVGRPTATVRAGDRLTAATVRAGDRPMAEIVRAGDRLTAVTGRVTGRVTVRTAKVVGPVTAVTARVDGPPTAVTARAVGRPIAVTGRVTGHVTARTVKAVGLVTAVTARVVGPPTAATVKAGDRLTAATARVDDRPMAATARAIGRGTTVRVDVLPGIARSGHIVETMEPAIGDRHRAAITRVVGRRVPTATGAAGVRRAAGPVSGRVTARADRLDRTGEPGRLASGTVPARAPSPVAGRLVRGRARVTAAVLKAGPVVSGGGTPVACRRSTSSASLTTSQKTRFRAT
jgi:hypothetical protein